MKEKYEGIRSGSYSEKAIDVVVDMRRVLGPMLAAKIGLFTDELGQIRRAVDLGFLQITKSDTPGNRNTKVYILGGKLKEHEYGALDDAAPQIVEPVIAPEARFVVPARSAPVFRPLNLAAMGAASYREGAWDFKNIPSVYARLGCE